MHPRPWRDCRRCRVVPSPRYKRGLRGAWGETWPRGHRSQRIAKISIEELVAISGLSIAQLGVQDFRQFISNLFVLGIHKLGHQNLGKETSKVIELNREFPQI